MFISCVHFTFKNNIYFSKFNARVLLAWSLKIPRDHSDDWLHLYSKKCRYVYKVLKSDISENQKSAFLKYRHMEYWNKLLWAENLLVTLQVYGTKLQGYWNAGKSDQYLLLCNEDLTLSGWAVFRIPYKKCTGVSFWIKSGHSQSDIFCHFREKYRNTYKIKCHDKGLKTADSSTSLSFIKL